jgi:hypothetical protein
LGALPRHSRSSRFSNRYETDFNSLLERGGDTTQHGERVTLVIGIFEAADNGRRRSDHIRQLRLRELHLGAKLVNPAADFVVGTKLFERLEPLWLAPIQQVVDDLQGIGSTASKCNYPRTRILSSSTTTSFPVRSSLPSLSKQRSRACSILVSVGGWRRSQIMPGVPLGGYRTIYRNRRLASRVCAHT